MSWENDFQLHVSNHLAGYTSRDVSIRNSILDDDLVLPFRHVGNHVPVPAGIF